MFLSRHDGKIFRHEVWGRLIGAELIQEFRHETNFNEAVKNLFHVGRGQIESDWHDFLVKEVEAR